MMWSSHPGKTAALPHEWDIILLPPVAVRCSSWQRAGQVTSAARVNHRARSPNTSLSPRRCLFYSSVVRGDQREFTLSWQQRKPPSMATLAEKRECVLSVGVCLCVCMCKKWGVTLLKSPSKRKRTEWDLRHCEICLDETLCLHTHTRTHRHCNTKAVSRLSSTRPHAGLFSPLKRCNRLCGVGTIGGRARQESIRLVHEVLHSLFDFIRPHG